MAYTNTTDTGVLDNEADQELYEYRPRDQIVRTIEDGAGGLYYQQDWQHGDLVTIKTGSPDTVTITAVSLDDLLMRRVIAYKSGTSQSDKTDFADDMIKEYVDENLLNATDTDRNLPARPIIIIGVALVISRMSTPEPCVNGRVRIQ